MAKFEDLTGKRFGRLTVVKRGEDKVAGKYKYVAWECSCDCGNEAVVKTNPLKEGRIKSCGCLHSEIARELGRKSTGPKTQYEDLTGTKFGRLLVIGDENKQRTGKCLCRCDCGNIKEVDKSALKLGFTLSCGCFNKEVIKNKISANGDNSLKLFSGTMISSISSERIGKNNKSGIKGVSWSKQANKWSAEICLQGKLHHLGQFKKIEDAAKARKLAEEKYFEPIIEKYEKEAGA